MMKVCVLQPDYSTSDVDYSNYDPPRNLSALLPGDEVHHVFLNKLTTYKQLKALSKENFDIYINLCEGYLDWSVPSIDVIHALEQLNLPYTGPDAIHYDPPKSTMKYVATCAGVRTPFYALLETTGQIASATAHLSYPLFIKPAAGGDSLGIDEHSLVHTPEQLERKVESLLAEGYDPVLAEEFVDGSEYTVLVAADPADATRCRVFQPVEYIFPPGSRFKTYALKTSSLQIDAHVPCSDTRQEKALRSAAEKIFTAFNGVGYARLDFRMGARGELYFLEINFTCSVFYGDGYEGSADDILTHDPAGKAGFLQHIIAEGMARHAAKQPKYRIRPDALIGYGIVASRFIKKNETIFSFEGRAQRIVTRRHAEQRWPGAQLHDFKQYAYPLSREVYVLWHDDPQQWAPQNHSCRPNTAYDGLNVIALADIGPGAELTLDYASFMNENMEPFACTCGSDDCKINITGLPGNTVSERERSRS